MFAQVVDCGQLILAVVNLGGYLLQPIIGQLGDQAVIAGGKGRAAVGC